MTSFDSLPIYCLVRNRDKYFPEAVARDEVASTIIRSFNDSERKEIRDKFADFKEELIVNKYVSSNYLLCVQAYSFFQKWVFVDGLQKEVGDKIKKMLHELVDLEILPELVTECNVFNSGRYKSMMSRLCEPYRSSITNMINLFGAVGVRKGTNIDFGSGQTFEFQPIAIIKTNEGSETINQSSNDKV